MLSDILNAAQDIILVAGVGILLLATYRGFQMGRVLMRGAYRNRAFWTGATSVALLLFTLVTFYSSSPLPFFVIVAVLLAFVDSSIKVAQETDFFHRSPLDWQRFRKPIFVLFFAFSAIGALAIYSTLSSDSLTYQVGEGLWFLDIGVSLSYSAAALAEGARRTPERTMRRFVKMLGLAIVCMVLFFTIWIPFSPLSPDLQTLGNLIAFLFLPGAAYFLYTAVMSLSPMGHIEKEVEAPHKEVAAESPGQVIPRPQRPLDGHPFGCSNPGRGI
jgi:hypothetical protein